MPAAEASQWVDATMPNVPASCGRVVNEEPCGSISAPWLRIGSQLALFLSSQEAVAPGR